MAEDAPDPRALNRAHWRERARLHPQSEMYRRFFDRLRAGEDCLSPIELALLGDIDGLRVLHLQCHIGHDSLSLVRHGADVYGLDFAPEAVAQARLMSEELALPAQFFVGDVLEGDRHPELGQLRGQMDRVFASYGVICWIEDLRRWMEVAAAYLRPGGRLVLVDTHPFADVFDDQVPLAESPPTNRYFHDEAIRWEESGSYAQRDAETEANVSYEWSHRVSTILNAAIDAGLRISRFGEHVEGYWPKFPGQALAEDGHWRLPPEDEGRVPLVFSLAAEKPE